MSDLGLHGQLGATAPSRIAANIEARRSRAFSADNLVLPTILIMVILVFPSALSLSERTLVGFAISASITGGILLARLVSRDWAVFANSCIKVAASIAVVAVVPELFPATIVYITTSVVATAAVQPRADAIYLAMGSGTCLAIVAILRSERGWFLALFVLAIVAFSTRAWSKTWRAQRIETRQRFDDVIDSANMFFWEADMRTGEILSIRGNSLDTLGYHPHELLMLSWDEVVVAADRARVRNWFANGIAHGDRTDSMMSCRHRDGHVVRLRQLVRAGHDGTLVGSSIDITALHEANEVLRYQAEHDMLTALPNRLRFTTELDRLLGAQEAAAVGLLLLDLDGFKEINDTLGHNIGDQVLQVLADRFRNSLDDSVLIARIGGDEFAALVVDDPSRIDEERMLAFASELMALIDAPLQLGGLQLVIRASAGIAIAPAHADTGEELLQRADIAMYQAKASVESVVFYAPMADAHSLERLHLSARIGTALENGEFELWFQPKVELATGKVVGVEGLARWRHPDLGILTPDRFLSLLSVAGEYQAFTNQMVRGGIDFLSACEKIGSPLSVAVNLGAVSFLDGKLPDRIKAMLEVHGVDPGNLVLEVTEEEIQMDRDTSVDVFRRLEELGLRLSIDDFGTGYSSLARLRSLRITELKIDRSFVSGVTSDSEDRAIVSAIIGLAKQLNQTTVAEGIETEEQLAELLALGCDIGQGYLFARPMSSTDLMAMLGTGPWFGTERSANA